MVRIGIIGMGFMGVTHFEGAMRMSDPDPSGRRRVDGPRINSGQVTAIATRNQQKLDGDWTMIQGNFGPPGTLMDLSGIATYADYHDLLADPDIDLVDICLPTDQHEDVTLAALAAGKHVLVEKPIAVSLDAARRMVAAAAEADRLLMVAQVLPFFPEFAYVRKVADDREYGQLLAAHFRRVISPPDWSEGMSDFRNLGGWGVDLHIHDNHYIGLLCGVPGAIMSRGLLQDGLVNHVHSQYIYEPVDGRPGPAVTCVSGGIAASGLAFAHGFEVYFERATVEYSAGTYGGEWVCSRPLTLVTSTGLCREPDLPGGTEWYSAFTDELQAAVDGVAAGAAPRVISSELALDALKLCYAEAESIGEGRAVSLD
ncbi:MAG: Gfo/Idh/MocA family oxidoreductase [Planctomycetaceae bacterium]